MCDIVGIWYEARYDIVDLVLDGEDDEGVDVVSRVTNGIYKRFG